MGGGPSVIKSASPAFIAASRTATPETGGKVYSGAILNNPAALLGGEGQSAAEPFLLGS
jgi:hypothetical protein